VAPIFLSKTIKIIRIVRHVEYLPVAGRTGAFVDDDFWFPERALAGHVVIEDLMRSTVE
jgi:hypothetical protein